MESELSEVILVKVTNTISSQTSNWNFVNYVEVPFPER